MISKEDDDDSHIPHIALYRACSPSPFPHFSLPRRLEGTDFKLLLRVSWISWVLLIVESLSHKLDVEWVVHLLVHLKQVAFVVDHLLVWIELNLLQLSWKTIFSN